MKVEVNTHVERRALEYPALEEQLDMLWHAMNRGEIPKAAEWFDTIRQVKDTHQKA